MHNLAPNDAELVERARGGDVEAYGELVRRYQEQALSTAYLLRHGPSLSPAVHTLPAEIDEAIAREKLKALGLRIDTLTAEQEAFLHAWEAFA